MTAFALPAAPPEIGARSARLESFILSISGWRKVFAPDGDENGLGPVPHGDDLAMGAAIGLATAGFFTTAGVRRIALGRDSRPSGEALEQTTLRGLLAGGMEVVGFGLVAVPQFLAWVASREEIGGFVYISASHNPPGHNGFKMGYGDGSVLPGEAAPRLADAFRDLWKDDQALAAKWPAVTGTVNPAGQFFPGPSAAEQKSFYQNSLFAGAGAGDGKSLETFTRGLRMGYPPHPPTLLCDFNGSARSTAADGDILSELGVTLLRWQDTPGVFHHRIVPEGASLEPLRSRMAQAWERGEGPLWGWVPDCDGDRGNLVLALERNGRVVCEAPDAQTTFALSVLSALAFHTWKGPSPLPLAIAANDPTSLRIAHLCKAFGAVFAQAEVGEANVIAKAQELSRSGHLVPLLGEGSNGGNITPPGTVRDPMATQLALIRLLFLRQDGGPSLYAHALSRLGLPAMAEDAPAPKRLAHLLQFQDGFVSTSAFDSDALVRLQSKDQKTLKAHYEKLFVGDMGSATAPFLANRRLYSWRILNYEGTRLLPGVGNRSGDHSGGWKAEFLDGAGEVKAYVWMRGSRTEPVFRVMAEVVGDKAFEQELLGWHRALLARADGMSSGT